jgi:DNA-binding transcriptional LysR family regulator
MEERLRRFAAIVDYGSFTAAARGLHTSQPGLTSAVQKLERELKTSLLVRPVRKIALTPAGRIAYEQGRQLGILAANLAGQLAELQEKKQRFTLGCIDSIADELVRGNGLQRLEQRYELSLTIQSSQALLTQLKHGQADLVLAVHQPSTYSGFASRSVGREPFVLAAAAGSAKTTRADLPNGRLSNFLAYNQGSTTLALLNEQLQANGLTAEPRFYSTNPAVLQEIALKDRGVAALPRRQVQAVLQNGGLEIIELKKALSRPITAYWQKGRRLPVGTTEFLAQLSRLLHG